MALITTGSQMCLQWHYLQKVKCFTHLGLFARFILWSLRCQSVHKWQQQGTVLIQHVRTGEKMMHCCWRNHEFHSQHNPHPHPSICEGLPQGAWKASGFLSPPFPTHPWSKTSEVRTPAHECWGEEQTHKSEGLICPSPDHHCPKP